MSATTFDNAVAQRLRRRNAILLKALQSAVWRDRAQFPGDPFCILCGASRKWAAQYGHKSTCAISRGASREPQP